MRVQFTVNDDEWTKLKKLAEDNGYPDVPSYCRDISLQERTYADFWKTITEKISKMESGQVFALRDLVPLPPSNLGVKLYNNQKVLGIEVNSKKDSLGTNTFRKL